VDNASGLLQNRGRARAEARIDPRPLRMSCSTAHGAQVVWPLDYMSRAPCPSKHMHKTRPFLLLRPFLRLLFLVPFHITLPPWEMQSTVLNVSICLSVVLSQQELIRRWDSERELFYDDIVHVHHDRFTALFPGPPGWAGARRELLDFMVQRKINKGRHTDHPAGRHSIRTNQCLPPPFPYM